MAALRALCDAVIFTGEAFVEGHALLLKDGKVLDLVRKAPAEADIVSCRKQILTPGLIDIQANGGGNILFNNTPTEDACLAIAKAHRRFGTARLLPTLITDRPDVTPKAIAATRAARKKDASVLGIHIEGPHLETAARGVHKADFLRKLSAADKEHYRPEKGEIILLTVAPEATTPLEIKTLHAEGVIISLGHTKADGAQIQAAREAGATGFTHLFNGMNFNRGANGLSAPVKAALEDKKSWCSIIADGHHVSVEYIRLALEKKPGRIFLVSDAMAPSASDHPQPFSLYGEKIRVENGQCVNPEGKLAGSMITLLEAVRYCLKEVGVEPGEALRMASSYPAAFLGLHHKLGKLLPGYTGDVTALDENFAAKAVWIEGERSS